MYDEWDSAVKLVPKILPDSHRQHYYIYIIHSYFYV